LLTGSHRSGAQSLVPPLMQLPFASQVSGLLRIVGVRIPAQLAGAQTTPGVGWQLPSTPDTAQDVQVGHEDDPQQNPWTQLPVMHSVPAVQVVPFGLRLVHEPP
jgi:hypothetical protein